MNHRRARSHALAVLAVTAAVPFAACGDDNDDSGSGDGPAEAAFELKGSGKKSTLSAPDSVEAGTVRLSFKNSSKREGGVQLVRVEGDHSGKEALAAGNAWGEKNKPLPAWLFLAGGTPTTKPGKAQASTQALEPGNYVAIDLESSAMAEFEVTGDDAGKAPTASSRIDAVDYSFNASGLKAGASEVLIDNKGKQPHFVAGLPLKPGKTAKDAETFFKSDGKGGPPPFDEDAAGGFDTPVLEGGGAQVVKLNLKKGNYVLACFVPDRQGGPPHVAKGMVAEAKVE